MRRADRLFKIIQALRRRRTAVTARRLAEELEVSERTIYRDIADLSASGVPVRGEAGVGYLLERSFDLPPLMFDEQELEALVLGARVVHSWADPALAAAAADALAKVEAMLPERRRREVSGAALFALNFRGRGQQAGTLRDLRRATRKRLRSGFEYTDEEGNETQRTVRPLGLFYWGRTWTLGAWCELRDGFRNFRLDRIRRLELLDAFEEEPGKTIDDLFRHYEQEC
jgi:predicted DNA-binding transcriptional regulator YafY